MAGSQAVGADALVGFVRAHGLFGRDEPLSVSVLTGGVSSLVARVSSHRRCVVVKQALPRLRVADRWEAGVGRCLVEARCAAVLAEMVPGSVPAPLAADEGRHAFVMDCAPAGSDTWKARLLDGVAEPATAAAAGDLLARIHRATAARPSLAAQFDDRGFFRQLRVDPYLRTVAARHPDLAAALRRMVADLLARRCCLVHGDYSPKNLLVTPAGGLLLVDHEVAHWGDPAFDCAFVLNHLCLKALRFPERAPRYLACARALWDAYLADGTPAGPDPAEHTARLLGGLMLARVDGKSPVEYLDTDARRERVRAVATDLVRAPAPGPAAVLDRVAGVSAHA